MMFFVYLHIKSMIEMENPKYQSIFSKGKELFWKHGVKRVTIEEICREAGVSKMTFYKFFSNKTELARTIWIKVMEDSLEKFRNVVNSDMEFRDKVTEMFNIKQQAGKDISLEFINDVYVLPDLGLQPLVEKYGQESFRIFFDFLKDSQKKGMIRKEIKVEFIMYYFNMMSKMFDDAELVSHYDSPQELIMESMNFLFYGLTSKK